MNIKFIPKGDMCIVCKHVHRKCNHLPFNTYVPMGKPDKEGYVEVKCVEFDKQLKEELSHGS